MDFQPLCLIALQAAFIAAGILGVVPLSGVVTPFINYGKSSTIANFVLLGVLTSLSQGIEKREPNEPFRKQIAVVGILLGAVGVVILLQAARVQVFQADGFLGRGALILQADGHRRYTYNPRILEAARSIPRGSIYDRNGIPLATDSASLLQSFGAPIFSAPCRCAGNCEAECGPAVSFWGGDLPPAGRSAQPPHWYVPPNSSYIERDWNTFLQGYNDRGIIESVQDRPGGPEHATLRRDFRELMPLVRYRYRPDKKEVRDLLDRNRDIHLSVDVRLQLRLASILEKYIRASGTARGAARDRPCHR